MRNFKLDTVRHEDGLNAYRVGTALSEIIETASEFEKLHDQPDLTNDQHDAIAMSGPSLLIGFADGLIDDIRLIAAARRGQRA